MYVPDQKLFSCFQVQYKNIPVNYAILSSVIPEGLPYNEVTSCLSWYYLEKLQEDQTTDFTLQNEHTVSYDIHLNSDLARDSVFVFNQSYSPYWKLKADDVDVSEHFPVNGYANAWVIPAGTTQITLYFAPEKMFRYMLGLLLITIVLLVSAQIVSSVRSHK